MVFRPPLFFHLIVYVSAAHAGAVRTALASAGAGKIGNYDSCSFSMHGIGRFRPLKLAHPAVGVSGKMEEVEEERIEVILPSAKPADVQRVIRAVKAVHPYEEPAIHLLPMEDYHAFL